ncbi:MAG: ribbon-helix-helix domain-containing protein [Candidatus Thermoplasmatota archaeon]|nr:ribbon-helix-helix domain-containing protein [Candidatus Thermoplasmatota archaeon]
MVRKEMSERITVRLPKKMVNEIDNLIVIGEYSNRSDIVREAVKLFLNTKIKDVVESLSAKEKLQGYVTKAIEQAEEEEKYLRE